MRNFYEFFAGGGMARAGLGKGWSCRFANDFDRKKGAAYDRNWGLGQIVVGDVREVKAEEIPGRADLAWASFPCQDLSLAGGGAGLKGERSGTFWPFWSLISALEDAGRAPKVVVLENVCGLLSASRADDFVAIANAFSSRGYRFGALVIDAALFVPQSRPRLFLLGVKDGVEVPAELICPSPEGRVHTRQLITAYAGLGGGVAERWLWWKLPVPPERTKKFGDILEVPLPDEAWHSPEETRRLLAMMSMVNIAKVKAAQKSGNRMVGGVYKRTRRTADDAKVQRAEIRFDDVSGCLRTPAGGSSRQLIVIVKGECVRSRLITARETARLMGLPDRYILPNRYNEAYHLTGDGVVVPVVRHLARYIIEPIVDAAAGSRTEPCGLEENVA
jgi:DNA (cytosine-5)-methyltransferase 1